jgi:hypothetical protein
VCQPSRALFGNAFLSARCFHQNVSVEKNSQQIEVDSHVFCFIFVVVVVVLLFFSVRDCQPCRAFFGT